MNDVLLARHGVEVGDLDVVASISVPHAEAVSHALAAPNPCSGGCRRAPMAPGGDRTRGSVAEAARQDVLDAEPEVFEEHLGSLQVDAIWVFLKEEVTSSLLEIDLVLGFDRGDQAFEEILLELSVEILVRVGE